MSRKEVHAQRELLCPKITYRKLQSHQRMNRTKIILAKNNTQQPSVLTENIKKWLTEIIPKLAQESFQMQRVRDELRGAKLKLTLDISGIVYSYIIRNGFDLDVIEGDIDSPHVRISVAQESISKMADMKIVDMLIGMQKQFTREKFELLSELKGSAVFQLKNPNDTVSEITVTFNNTEKPKTILRLSTQNADLIIRGGKSLFSLLVSGEIKVEGFITFVMKLQPLFIT